MKDLTVNVTEFTRPARMTSTNTFTVTLTLVTGHSKIIYYNNVRLHFKSYALF